MSSNLPQPSTTAPGATSLRSFELQLSWADAVPGSARLAEALVALLGAHAAAIRIGHNGSLVTALGLDAALPLLRRAPSRVALRLPGDLVVDLSGGEPSSLVVNFGAPLPPRPPAPTWLQADPSLRSPLSLLRLPWPAEGGIEPFFHALIGLAHRCAPLDCAELRSPDGRALLHWSRTGPGDFLAAEQGGALWIRRATPGEDAELHVTGSLGRTPEPDSNLVATLTGLLACDPPDTTAMVAAIAAALPGGPRIRLEALESAPATFHLPPPADTLLRLVPTQDAVAMEYAQAAAPERTAFALAHAAAHLRLGHLRPGDSHGHWDTWETISDPAPARRWDREVRQHLPAWCTPAAPRRASLAECTPLEKSWLVLLDHIGRMVGEARTLHPAAERYQPAAYQRQAAQRLVAQLEEYGGAMLCDGVGLGKTYVATTVLVHYAHAWQERLAAAGRSPADDPFRVTILSPNSVVSTWQREAIVPLGAHGVVPANVRILSHTKLSRILPSSAILASPTGGHSDMEHLLLSDLVVVDEAHNFRSVGARRTVVLRDLLRLQPRKELRRKVLLLTATPVNNSLEDLRQQAALLFCTPLWFNENTTPEGYRGRVQKDARERIEKATRAKGGDVAAILVHGNPEVKFSYAPEFRTDMTFGVQVPRVGDYLKEQEKRLAAQQVAVRDAMQAGQALPAESVRIAGALLDRIVVQRSRALCKQIEREQGSDVKLLFRTDAPPPEKLVYEDAYDDTRDVLARFLPMFETGEDAPGGPIAPLSLKVYQWAAVRDGEQDPDEVSSVVGLQRVLVLKRLESSPIAFLITLLRLLALHAYRLKQIVDLCLDLADHERAAALEQELLPLLDGLESAAREHLDLLLTGEISNAKARALLARWSKAHREARPAAGADDPPPAQLDMFRKDDPETASRREQFDRLWEMHDDLTRDFGTLLAAAPGLADLVFGRFDRADWPRKFINGGQGVDWPASAAWAQRLTSDAKLRRLVGRLLLARAEGQKVIVFSQFTDTLAYVNSVLQATTAFDEDDWAAIQLTLELDTGRRFSAEDVRALVERSAVISGQTEDRDQAIHAFAPFYRLGPRRPSAPMADPEEQAQIVDLWRQGWLHALRHPTDVLLATDVLAEGVNLQDAALLVNYDVHWNPVRMIQRSGRIDRRLNPAIEEAEGFPDLVVLAREAGEPMPRYWWHAHPHAAPVTANLLLPDELEAELQLRERIANKTLAIDFTLGLEQGTGAEADWMADYRYQGISALNAWQGDRAIEQVAGYQERIRRLLGERGIEAGWVQQWNGWLREDGAGEEAPVLAYARIGLKGQPTDEYTRLLTPRMEQGVPHWLWSPARPGESLLNRWLVLDGQRLPPATRDDLPWSEDASRPVAPDDLVGLAARLVDHPASLHERPRAEGARVQQGGSAISAGRLGSDEERAAIKIAAFRLIQARAPIVAIVGHREARS